MGTRWEASLHEAGHAVVAVILGEPVYEAVIEQGKSDSDFWCGRVTHTPEDRSEKRPQNKLDEEIARMVANPGLCKPDKADPRPGG